MKSFDNLYTNIDGKAKHKLFSPCNINWVFTESAAGQSVKKPNAGETIVRNL